MEHFSIIRIYCSRERPTYLPYYVSDKMFVVEVCKQYRFWAHFFHEKRKRKFIPLPWKIGEITLKSTTNINEFSVQFDQFNLKVADEVKGFDPNQLFMKHMIYVGYNVTFANTFLFGEEEGDSQNPQALPIEKKQEDIEIVLSTTEQHRQHGKVVNERSTQSPNTSQKSILPKQKSQPITQEQNKSAIDNSNDGGDQNPPKGSLERPHKLPVTSKRKIQTNQEGGNEGAPEDEIVLEDMDLDVNIEDIEFPDEEQRIQESREVAVELVT
jgi:hypothetical protein